MFRDKFSGKFCGPYLLLLGLCHSAGVALTAKPWFKGELLILIADLDEYYM